MPRDRIKVKVDGDRLVVTMRGTSYRAFFLRSPDEPKLVQAASLAVDNAAAMSHKDFEAMAWEAAIAKAKELGWIAIRPK
jgi:hypothetical protein